MSIEETAEVMKVSAGTVMREWTFARAWLRKEMGGGEGQEAGDRPLTGSLP